MTNQLVLRALVLSIAATFAGPGAAVATLIPIEQDRSIYGFARVDSVTESDSAAATDFAPFAESVEALVNLGYVGRSFASQDSTIAPSLIVADGTAEARGNASFDSWIQATSSSDFSLTFELETERTWAIDAAVDVSEGVGNGSFSAALSLTLEGPGGWTILALTDEEQLSDQVVLAPGIYVLSAQAYANAGPTDLDNDSGAASFSVRLQQVPEPNALALLALGLGLLGLQRVAGRTER